MYYSVTEIDFVQCIKKVLLLQLSDSFFSFFPLGKGDGEWAESLEVCREDFMSALSSLVPSVSKEELEMYRNKKSFSNVT